MTRPRIEPGERRDVGVVNWAIAAVGGRVNGTGPLKLFLVLGRHRRLFRGWLRFAGRMMPGGRLPRVDTELVIVRVASARGCDYELDHHRRLARRAGLSPTQLEVAIADGPADDRWSERQRALLVAADELLATHDLEDATWEALRSHLDERQAIELVLLVGHYEMLATAITTLRVPLDH